jgi:hypothetical protein
VNTTSPHAWRRLAAAGLAAVLIGAAGPALAQTPPTGLAGQAAPAGVKPQPKPPTPTPAKVPPAATKKPVKPKKPPRIFVSGDGGGQLTSAGFTSLAGYSLYGENATTVATQPDASGVAVAVRGAVLVWRRRLSVGAGVTGFWSTRSADVTASLPHPFFFNRPRSVEGSVSGLARSEAMVAVECAWLMRVNARTDLQVFAGPAFFKVRADMPTGVAFTEAYPYDAATITGVESERVSGSAAGFTVGGDVTYMFTRTIGLGGHLRFSAASASLTSPGGPTTSVDLGGLQVGGGLRLRF